MKKTMKSIAYSAALILALALLAASCKREPLHEPFSNYYLKLEPDFNVQHIKPRVPGMYEAIFYDKDTHKEIAQSYLGSYGGYIYDLAPGTYELVVYSFDSGNTKVSGVGTYPGGLASVERYAEGDTLSYNAPDHLMVARDPEFTIPMLYDREDVEYLYAYPKTIAQTWCVVIDGIKGLKNAATIDIYFTGHARSKHLASEELDNKATTIHVPGTINSDGDKIYTPFCTFGKFPDQNSILRLVIMDQNQRKYVCYADVTCQFDNPENTGHWIYAKFDIEIDPKKDGGMMPDVTEWGENVFDYDIY